MKATLGPLGISVSFGSRIRQQSMVSTNLACKISLRVDGTIGVPGADTHPRLRLAAKLSLGDVTAGKTR